MYMDIIMVLFIINFNHYNYTRMIDKLVHIDLHTVIWMCPREIEIHDEYHIQCASSVLVFFLKSCAVQKNMMNTTYNVPVVYWFSS